MSLLPRGPDGCGSLLVERGWELRGARDGDRERARGVGAAAVSDRRGVREGQRGGEEVGEAEPEGGEEDPPRA